jgi:hypothetical protein
MKIKTLIALGAIGSVYSFVEQGFTCFRDSDCLSNNCVHSFRSTRKVCDDSDTVNPLAIGTTASGALCTYDLQCKSGYCIKCPPIPPNAKFLCRNKCA